MYFMSLASSVSVVEVISTVERITKTIKIDPVKLERMLLDGEAVVAKTTTIQKAKKLANIFRSAGVRTLITEG